MKSHTGKFVQDVFIRVCKDSGFGLDEIMAAQIAAGALKIHPIEVWIAFSDLDTMQRIAGGKHPVCTQ